MMKKFLSMILAGLMTLSFAACGNPGAGQRPESTPTATAPSSSEAQSSESLPESEAPKESQATEVGDSKSLVAYFSYSGNTEKIANMIADETSAELFQIVTVEAYPESYNDVLDVAQNEQNENARPELAAQVDGMENYDVIYLGWPCWWGDCPMAVLTFLESYDFSGKTIVPFTTHGGSSWGSSLTTVADACPDASLLDGLSVRDDDVDSAAGAVSDWLDGLAIAQ